jgi:predicted RNA-binding protein with PIN domain
MTNKVLIDGWNVCWKFPEISKYIPEQLSTARLKFNMLVKQSFQKKNVRYQIIYDGQPDVYFPENAGRDTNVRFAHNPQKADHLILTCLKKEKRPREWTVITSDRGLARSCRSLDAQVISSEEFIVRMQKEQAQHRSADDERNPVMSAEEVKYWLHTFKNR